MGGLFPVTGSNQDSFGSGPCPRLDVLQRVPYHVRAGEIKLELLCRSKQEPRRRFPAVAGPKVIPPALCRMVGAVVDAVEAGPFSLEHVPDSGMDLMDGGLVEDSPGDAGQIGRAHV